MSSSPAGKGRFFPLCPTLMLCSLLLLISLPGCGLGSKRGSDGTGVTVSVVTPDFFGIGEDLARQLVGNYRAGKPPAGTRLILTNMVDLDNLENTSRFGRTLSEALATQLFRHGFAVEEVRKGDALLIREPDGELVLSRDISRLARKQSAHAVVAGTYSLTPATVIVNVRMLDSASPAVLSVAGIEVQRSPAINHLLSSGKSGGGNLVNDAELSGYERIR